MLIKVWYAIKPNNQIYITEYVFMIISQTTVSQ